MALCLEHCILLCIFSTTIKKPKYTMCKRYSFIFLHENHLNLFDQLEMLEIKTVTNAATMNNTVYIYIPIQQKCYSSQLEFLNELLDPEWQHHFTYILPVSPVSSEENLVTQQSHQLYLLA